MAARRVGVAACCFGHRQCGAAAEAYGPRRKRTAQAFLAQWQSLGGADASEDEAAARPCSGVDSQVSVRVDLPLQDLHGPYLRRGNDTDLDYCSQLNLTRF